MPALLMERTEAAADESLAALRARISLGITIVALITMMAITISNYISEKPFRIRALRFFLSRALSLRPRNLGPAETQKLWHAEGQAAVDVVPRLQSWQPLYFQPDAVSSQH